MKKLAMPILAAWAFLNVGCETDRMARLFVEPNTTQTKMILDLAGTGGQMVKQGRIDLHRTVTTGDKVDLDVWVLRSQTAKQGAASLGTVVVLHGFGESKAMFPYFGAAQILARKGYDVVLMDLRHHGRSTGKYITYGAKEKHDVKAVLDALADAIHMPIYAFGVNLGGAVAIQWAAIDDRCKGVMAIVPYKDFTSYARLGLLLLPQKDFDNVVAAAGRIASFDPGEASSVLAAQQLKCPLLVVHGLLDLSVPLQHSEEIVAAAPGPKKLLKPSLENFIRPAILEDWIADNIDKLAKTGLK